MESKDIINNGFEEVRDQFIESIIELSRNNVKITDNILNEIAINTIRVGALLSSIRACVEILEE